MWKTSNTRSVYAVKLESEWLPVVYNKTTKQVITVLPLSVLDDYQDALKEIS